MNMRALLHGVVVLTGLRFWPLSVFAEGMYVGAGVQSLQLKVTDPLFGNAAGNGVGGYLSLGHSWSDNLAAELRLGSSSISADQLPLPTPVSMVSGSFPTGTTLDVELQADYLLSVLGKAGFALAENIGVYGLFGWSSVRTSYRALAGPILLSTQAITNGSGLSYGGGVQHEVGTDLKLSLEWTSYIHRNDSGGRTTSADGVALATTYEF